MTSLRSSPVSPLTQASRCSGMRHPRPFWLKCSASWSRGSCASWWALAGLFAGLFAADSHAEAQQKAIAAPAHQAGVVLEASGSTFIRPFPEETPTCRLLDKMLDLWLRGSMTAVAGRAFVLVQWFRIALPRAFWKASRSMDSEPNQEHWAAKTTPDGSRCFASSSSRWWRYHGHPSVPWHLPRGSQGSWLHVEVSRETAHSELLPRTWQRKFLALTWRAFFYCTAFLSWRWLRGVFQRASRALSFRSKMVRFD